jgi:hypothetical protein
MGGGEGTHNARGRRAPGLTAAWTCAGPPSLCVAYDTPQSTLCGVRVDGIRSSRQTHTRGGSGENSEIPRDTCITNGRAGRTWPVPAELAAPPGSSRHHRGPLHPAAPCAAVGSPPAEDRPVSNHPSQRHPQEYTLSTAPLALPPSCVCRSIRRWGSGRRCQPNPGPVQTTVLPRTPGCQYHPIRLLQPPRTH